MMIYNYAMRRREFILFPAIALGASVARLRADHHILSMDPLIVDFDLSSLEGRYTRVDDFYIRNHYPIPQVPEPHVLRVEGEVEKPLSVGREDLARLAKKQVGAVLECAGDPVKVASLVSDGLWDGWTLGDVISLAGPRREGLYVHLFGRDGYARSVPIGRAMNEGLLVSALNSRPLVRNHGAPWRALFPGWYGADSVKWLERISLAPEPLPPAGDTYLEVWRGPSGSVERKPLPRIQVNSVITSPVEGAVLHPGKVQIRGLAWSGSGRISEVQVSADGGKLWDSVAVDNSTSQYDWALWQTFIDLTQRGPIEVICKAKDSAGNAQPSLRDSRRVDSYGNNVWNRVRCLVV